MAYDGYDATKKNCVTLLVPGFMGSSLEKHAAGGRRQLWPPLLGERVEEELRKRGFMDPPDELSLATLDGFLAFVLNKLGNLAGLDLLQRTPDGQAEKAPGTVLPNGVLKKIGISEDWSLHIYDEFLKGFEGKAVFERPGSVQDRSKPSFTMFAYDFRLDLAGAAEQLAEAIKTTQQRAGVQKINVVGHSMGALVTFACLARHPELAPRIAQAFLLGGPLNGTPEALAAFFASRTGTDWALRMTSDSAKLSVTWPSFYQMLPSDHYQEKTGGFVRLFDRSGPLLSCRAGYSFLGGAYFHDTLLSNALAFHKDLDEKFGAGPFPALTTLVHGQAETPAGLVVPGGRDVKWRIFALGRKEQREVLAPDRLRPVVKSATDAFWCLVRQSAGKGIADTFQIVDAATGLAISAITPNAAASLTRPREDPGQSWRVNAAGELENGYNLVLQLGPADGGVRTVTAAGGGTSGGAGRRFALDMFGSGAPTERIMDDGGDGTVTRIGERSIPNLGEGKRPFHVVTNVNHLDLARHRNALSRLKGLLQPSDRTSAGLHDRVRLRSGPAGGLARVRGGNAADFDISGNGDSKISRIRWRGTGDGCVHGLAEVKYSNTAISAPVGGNGGAQEEVVLGANEYITSLSGTTGMEGSYEVVKSLRIATTANKPYHAGDNKPAKGAFNLSAPAGYHINGFFGRAGTLLDCLGVVLDPLPEGVSGPLPALLRMGPSGRFDDVSFGTGDGPAQEDIYKCVSRGELRRIVLTSDGSVVKSVALHYRLDRGTPALRFGEAGPQTCELELRDGESFAWIRGEIGLRAGAFVAPSMLTRLVVGVHGGARGETEIGCGSGGSVSGDPLPFQYFAPQGYLLSGLFGRAGNWGISAIGPWFRPVDG